MYEKVWALIWWIHSGCFLIDDSAQNIGGESSWCSGGLDGGWAHWNLGRESSWLFSGLDGG